MASTNGPQRVTPPADIGDRLSDPGLAWVEVELPDLCDNARQQLLEGQLLSWARRAQPLARIRLTSQPLAGGVA